MTIPRKIRIAGVDYLVNFEERLNDGSRMLLGQIDYDKTTIKLEPNAQSDQGKCQTLLHEILHGISKHFNLDINNNEDIIDKLANGLYMVIKDNPELFSDKRSE